MRKRFPRARAIAALKDISDNEGIMLLPSTSREAAILWREIRKRGWVKGHQITPAGCNVLRSLDDEVK